MAEQEFIIDTPDGLKIYGLINSPNEKQNDKAILHIHGLEGYQADYAAVNLAHTMPKHGYDVIRANLYHWKPNTRSLFECSIRQHADDINLVAKHFKQKYKKLFATGHSYGGPSLITSEINQFDAVSLWDPCFLPCESFNFKDFDNVGKYYVSPNGTHLVVSKEFIDESKIYDRAKAIELSNKCTAPLQVIYAEYWAKYGESFHTHAKGPTDERTILESKHAFYEEGAIEPLLNYTREWFDKF